MHLRHLFAISFLLIFFTTASGQVPSSPASGSLSPVIKAGGVPVPAENPATLASAVESPPQPASDAAPIVLSDPESTTLDLTLAALNMLTSRAQAGLRLLKAAESSTSLFQRNPQAERTTLEESWNAYSRKLEDRNWQAAYESLTLDIKILESRRDIVQSRVSGIEQRQKETQEQFRQAASDLEESRKLMTDLEQRFVILQEMQKHQPTPLGGHKLQLIASLRQARETYQTLLQETQGILQSRQQQTGQDLTTGKDTLDVYKDLLSRFAQLQTQFDEKASQVNSRNLEEQARTGLEGVRREQNTLQESLETLERQLLQLASGSSRVVLNAQRESQLAHKESLEESSRLFESLLRQSRLMQQFGPFLRPTGFPGLPLDQVSRTRAEATDLLQGLRDELKLVQKKKELFLANRQLLEKAVSDAEIRPTTPAAEFREELKARRQHLKYLGEAGRKCVEQENVLNVLIGDLEKVQAAVKEFLLKKREEELFGRKIMSWRPSFPTLVETTIRTLPAKMLRLITAADEELGIGLLVLGLALLFLGPLAGHHLTRKFLPAPVSEPAPATIPDPDEETGGPLPVVAPWKLLLPWVFAQSRLIGLIIPLAALALSSQAGSDLFFLPFCLVSARLLFTLISQVLTWTSAALPFSSAAVRRLAAVFLMLTPVIIWLRTLEDFPELVFLTEFSLKILLILPAYTLFRHRDEAVLAVERFFGTASGSAGIFLGMLYRAFTALLVPGLLVALYGFQNLALWFFYKTLALLAVLVLLSGGRAGVDHLSARWFSPPADDGTPSPQASFLHILCRKSLRFLIWIIALIALIKIFGLSRDFPLLAPLLQWTNANGAWVSGFFIKLGLILGIVILALDFSTTIGESILAYVRQTEHLPNTESERRASTLVQIFKTTTRVLVFGIAGIMVLQEIGVDIKPLLTGAGILGVAIGFGSQSLIKDFFSGFFILVENQFRVGDVIDVNGKTGVVEKINLKTTVLRALDGSIYILPNGEITSVKNMTFTWSRAVLEIGIGYNTDIDKAMDLLQKIGDELRFHKLTQGNIIERPEVLGVERLEDSAVVLRMLVKTKPLTQWDVARVFRKRILEVFRKEGIEIPFPQKVVTVQADPELARLLHR